MFDFEVFISSPDERFANIGTVRCGTYLNGGRETTPASYRNTLLRGVRECVDILHRNVNGSLDAEKLAKTIVSAPGSSTNSPASLSDVLQELSILLNSGAISDEEYNALRTKALDKYLE